MRMSSFYQLEQEDQAVLLSPPRLGVVEAIRRLVEAADAQALWGRCDTEECITALPQAQGFGGWLPRALNNIDAGDKVESLVHAWIAHRTAMRRTSHDRQVGAPVGTTRAFGREVAPALSAALARLRTAYPSGCATVFGAVGVRADGCWLATPAQLRPLWLASGCKVSRLEGRLAMVLRAVERGWAPRTATYSTGTHWGEALEWAGIGTRRWEDGRWVGSAPARRWEEWFQGTILLGDRAPSRICQVVGRAHLRGAHCTAWAAAAWWRGVCRATPVTFQGEPIPWKVTDIPWEEIRAAARLLPAHRGPGMAKAARAARVWGWMGSIPRTPAVRDLDPALVQSLRESDVARRCFFRLLQQVLSTCPEEQRRDTVNALARAVVSWEGNRSRVEAWLGLGGDVRAVHDRGTVCGVTPWPAEVAEWAWGRKALWSRATPGGYPCAALADVARVATAHTSWAEMGITTKTSLEAAVALMGTLQYKGTRSLPFAREAARWGVSPDAYPALETRWLAAQRVPFEGIPRVQVQNAGLEARVLDRSDPRALFAGEHTGCCQHPGGAGAAAAWASVEDPNSAVLVFERHGGIARQAWIWRGSKRPDVLVLDSLEGHTGVEEDVKALLLAVAREFVGVWGIREVVLGTAYGYRLHGRPPGPGATECGCPSTYTDASRTVVLAREGE